MTRTFFTADHHFGHARVIELCRRPFPNIADMHRQLIGCWNAVVRPDDDVWHLGDFAYCNREGEAAGIWHRLNGRKHLVIGNHDSAGVQALPWASVSQMREIAVDGQRVFLAHYPHLEWPGFFRGAVHLFGHVHGNNPGVGRSTDVGVDVWDFRPVTLPEILVRIGDRT